MAYKILYIEDLDPGSIVHDLKSNGFEAEHYNPESLEALVSKTKDYDLLLLDFRLTENKMVVFDAPTIAQTVRTIGGSAHIDMPIVLISTEVKITDYYKDYSSQDLFDFSVSKEIFLGHLEKYTTRLKSVINAYKLITETNKNLEQCLSISANKLKSLDYRIIEQLNGEMYKNDIFAFNSYLLNQIIRSVGVLIGEEVLLARLGICKSSPDWKNLKMELEPFKYKGVYHDAYERWWSAEIEDWWKEKTNNLSLRRLSAEQRVEVIKKFAKYTELIVQKKTNHATSSNYWTICKQLKIGIDSIDGLELHHRELKPWQEKEYISIQAGLEASELFNFVKHSDKERLKEIASKL
ncbi:MAG: response regulator [Bacteroidia bacterium]|nr:response regulator [Bacteroidia bacterium]